MDRARAWWKAARPLAHANIAPAIVYGQALAWATCGAFDVGAAVLVHLFGLCDHLFIVFANDVADHESDARNRTYNLYSGGSRVLPEGRISPRALGRAAVVMAALVLVTSFAIAARSGRLVFVAVGLAALALLHAYSFAPLRLSYRGGGEILQGLGVGVVLPMAGFVAQCPDLARLPWLALAPTFVLGVAANVTTALPDAPSDRESAKRTWPVRRGERRARGDSLALILLGVGLLPFVGLGIGLGALACVMTVPLALVAANERAIDDADAEARDACRRFVTRSGAAIGYVLAALSVVFFTRAR